LGIGERSGNFVGGGGSGSFTSWPSIVASVLFPLIVQRIQRAIEQHTTTFVEIYKPQPQTALMINTAATSLSCIANTAGCPFLRPVDDQH
jgi:hypothetical protein